LGLGNGTKTCAKATCIKDNKPCLDIDSGECIPRTDPTYNVTSGQCRAGTTDCCCTDHCCCPVDLPCQQLNDDKCMPKVNVNGTYCKFDEKSGTYPKGCTCSAGTEQCDADARKCPCMEAVDLLFLVDDSCSIKQANWPAVQQGLQKMGSKVVVGKDLVHVGAYTFDYANHYGGFNLTKYMTTGAVSTALGQLPGISKKTGTFTCSAIKWAQDHVFSSARGGKVPKVMVVMTDGAPGKNDCGKDFSTLETVSAAARASGIKIISIGIGGTYNATSLQVMASKPYKDNVFTIDDYSPAKVASQIIAAACK
jgi:hypothetical protein